MRKIFVRTFLFSTLFFYLSVQSMAWGVLGHRIVGEIADKYLTAKARAEVHKILGNESIAMASNWADFIKSDTAYKYLGTWHYIDFKNGLSYAELQQTLKMDTAKDAYTSIIFLTKELKKKTLPADKKLMYLRLLIHIVGDIHQPLHVSVTGTAGGNTVKLTWFNEASNLHRVWDEHLIEFQQLSYTEYVKAINFTTAAQRSTWQKEPLSKWLFDSYSISEKLVDEISEPNPKLSFLYNYNHIATVNQQLLKGGVHLGCLLNEIFD